MATVRRARANGPPAPVPPPRAPLTAPPCRLAVDKNFDDCSLADFSSALLGYQSFAQHATKRLLAVLRNEGGGKPGLWGVVKCARALLAPEQSARRSRPSPSLTARRAAPYVRGAQGVAAVGLRPAGQAQRDDGRQRQDAARGRRVPGRRGDRARGGGIHAACGPLEPRGRRVRRRGDAGLHAGQAARRARRGRRGLLRLPQAQRRRRRAPVRAARPRPPAGLHVARAAQNAARAQPHAPRPAREGTRSGAPAP